jgi:hypothetical protein
MPAIIEGLGTELIVNEVYLMMRDQLNSAIAAIASSMAAFDHAYAQRMGAAYVPVQVEPVPLDNFHIGDIPSFVQTDDREANYPMVVVMPTTTVPDAENTNADQYDVFQNAIQIHSFARAMDTTDAGFELAYRRAMRMAEAVHRVVKTTSLWHLVSGVSGPMLVTRSEPWIFPSTDGRGEDWCWRAVMHQYQVKNYSTTP